MMLLHTILVLTIIVSGWRIYNCTSSPPVVSAVSLPEVKPLLFFSWRHMFPGTSSVNKNQADGVRKQLGFSIPKSLKDGLASMLATAVVKEDLQSVEAPHADGEACHFGCSHCLFHERGRHFWNVQRGQAGHSSAA